MAKKITGKAAASDASKVLRDGRTSVIGKTAAGSALSQREKKWKEKINGTNKERREIFLSYALFNLIFAVKLNDSMKPLSIYNLSSC